MASISWLRPYSRCCGIHLASKHGGANSVQKGLDEERQDPIFTNHKKILEESGCHLRNLVRWFHLVPKVQALKKRNLRFIYDFIV